MNAIDLPKLRNAEYLQYMKDFAGIINLNNPESLEIDNKLAAFTGKTTELEALFKKALASQQTQEVLALDQRRDDAINGIYYFLVSQSYHFDNAKKQNAQALLNNMALVRWRNCPPQLSGRNIYTQQSSARLGKQAGACQCNSSF